MQINHKNHGLWKAGTGQEGVNGAITEPDKKLKKKKEKNLTWGGTCVGFKACLHLC